MTPPDPRRRGAQEHPGRHGERARGAVEILNRTQFVGQHDVSVILGQRRLHLVAPAAQLRGVERDPFDGAAGRVAALVVRVVVAPARAPDQFHALAGEEVDHLVARSEEHFAALGRGRRTDIADHIGQVGQAVLVRVGDAVGTHQWIVRQPDDPAGEPRRTADQRLLFDDQRLEPAVQRGQPGDHAAPAATRDDQIHRAVPLSVHRASKGGVVKPRSAIGTSMVVLVFWIAGTKVL